MIRFECDYLEGAPQAVLEALMNASAQQTRAMALTAIVTVRKT